MPRRAPLSARGLRVAGTNLCLAALYALFAYAHVVAFAQKPRASLVLFVVLEALFAVFFVIRRPASEVAVAPVDWASTVLGTFLALLLRPTGRADLLAGEVLQALGVALGVLAIASLNRSLGLLPANRGIRSSGAYRLVRHPLYSSYFLSITGYVCTHASLRNLVIAALALASQVVRVWREERLLSHDPGYLAYKARTRWRLIPYLY